MSNTKDECTESLLNQRSFSVCHQHGHRRCQPLNLEWPQRPVQVCHRRRVLVLNVKCCRVKFACGFLAARWVNVPYESQAGSHQNGSRLMDSRAISRDLRRNASHTAASFEPSQYIMALARCFSLHHRGITVCTQRRFGTEMNRYSITRVQSVKHVGLAL